MTKCNSPVTFFGKAATFVTTLLPMELLKTIRNKPGINQQDMANLLGITRDHYARLAAAAAERFAALLPLLLHDLPLPPLPQQLPEQLAEQAQQLLQETPTGRAIT